MKDGKMEPYEHEIIEEYLEWMDDNLWGRSDEDNSRFERYRLMCMINQIEQERGSKKGTSKVH